MDCPPGMRNVTHENALRLIACIYGLVQAANRYHKRFVEILKSIGFEGGDVDPCLLWRKDKHGTVYVAIYVDDNFMVGDKKAIESVIRQLRAPPHNLVLKVMHEISDYLSCEIVINRREGEAWMGQPHLIEKLRETFGDEVKALRRYLTPGTPKLRMVREEDEAGRLTPELQSRYRSGVGMLLYLIKFSRPDIANSVRELSKVLDCSTQASYKEMLRIVKYVLDTPLLGLQMKPSRERGSAWNIVCFTDSDYACDPETRRSVSGYVIFVHGVPICWRSQAQRSVTLSSTEAEWIAMSEAVKDVIFLMHLVEGMGITIRYPITVRVDNVGAIFMSGNITTTGRTRHAQIRGRYVSELVEDGTLKIVFVRSEENIADIMTKNLDSSLFSRHAKELVKQK